MNNVESNKIEKAMQTPISVMLNMAKREIETHVYKCMELNGIEPALMSLVLRGILLDVLQAETEQISEKYVSIQSLEKQEA